MSHNRHNWPETLEFRKNYLMLRQCKIECNKLAKLRRHASRVDFAKIHLGKIHFRGIQFEKINSGKIQFGKIYFGKIHF